jgi:Predicted phosphoesterases, related to the Icc protein
VIAGDLTTHGTAQEAETAIRQLQETAKPVLVVAGNMDPPELDDLFFRLGVSINGQGVIVDDVGFFGVSAAPLSPLGTELEFVIMVIAVSCVKLLSAHNSTQHTSRKHKV